MTRKAEPPGRRTPRRRPPAATASEPPRARKAKPAQFDASFDSDFGLALAVMPALKRRPDA